MFREGVLSFLGLGRGQTIEDRYCQMCKDLGEDDCDNCDKNIEVIDV